MTLTIDDKRVFLSGPVKLTGYQAILRSSKFGYSLSATIPDDCVELLEQDRETSLEWCNKKLKNPKRSTLKPEPWIEDEETPGNIRLKFSWNEETKPTVMDSECTPITDEGIPLFGGCTVRLIFKQKPYILKDGVTYGTSLKLQGVQVLQLNRDGVGTDSGDLTEEDIANLFTVDQAHGLDADEAEFSRKAALETDEDSDF
jgi:hypothetical protein